MKLTKTNTMWGFPCYGKIHPDNAVCSDRFLLYYARRGIKVSKQYFSGPHIYGVRNVITKTFLEHKEFTHLLMIDSDMVYPPETLEVLLQLEKDIVSPICTTKKGNVLTERMIAPVMGIYDEATGDYPGIREVPNKPFKINGYAGTGVILIERRVLEKLPWPHFYGPKKERQIDYEMGVEGEDFMFCRNAIEAGFELWVEPRLPIGHIGKYLYTVKDIGKKL